MKRMICLFMFILFSSASVAAETSKLDLAVFDKLFSDWTYAFNHKELDKSCELFSKSMTANYQNTPEKNYETLCNGFKKVFANPQENYQYDFKIHQVYRSNNLAAVRITWYLKIFKNGKLISQSQDEGLDILQKNILQQWQIVNYLGYPVKK